jgi:hypothetical protein
MSLKKNATHETNSKSSQRFFFWFATLVLSGVLLAPAGCKCSGGDRPKVPESVPVAAEPTQGEAPAEAAGEEAEVKTNSPLPLSAEEAMPLELARRADLTVPLSGESHELWFKLPNPSKAASLRLQVSGRPEVRWKVSFHAMAAPDYRLLLSVDQPTPGNPMMISGIAAGPNAEPLLLRVKPIWQRAGAAAVELRVSVDGATRRPGEETEPLNHAPSNASSMDPVKGAEGTLDFPDDRDCVRLPAYEPEKGSCPNAEIRVDLLTREPINLLRFDAQNRFGPTAELGGEEKKQSIVLDSNKGRGFCISRGPLTKEPVKWTAVIQPGECSTDPEVQAANKTPDPATAGAQGAGNDPTSPGATTPQQEPQPELVMVGHRSNTIRSGSVEAGSDKYDKLLIQATETPAVVVVDGKVEVVWDGNTNKLPVLRPGQNAVLVVRAAEGETGSVDYQVHMTALGSVPIVEPGVQTLNMGGRGAFSAVPPGKAVSLRTPNKGAAERERWNFRHVGPARSPRIRLDARDNSGRAVTSRILKPAEKVTLVLPVEFGPYTLEVKADSFWEQFLPFEVAPGRDPNSPPDTIAPPPPDELTRPPSEAPAPPQ